MTRVPRLLDVSVSLRPGLPSYPGNPDFEAEPVTSLGKGDPANVTRLTLGTHTGTHVDAPKHFFDDGTGVDGLPLDLLIGRTRVVEVSRRGGIQVSDLSAAGLREDLRILLKTPNSAFWNGGGFREDYTYLSKGAARYLVEQGVKVVGIDYLSIEEFNRKDAPAHHVLLSEGVVVIEGLNLSEAEAGMYEMFCLPLLLEGGDGAPARVVLKR